MATSQEAERAQRLTKAFKSILNTIDNIIATRSPVLETEEVKRYVGFKTFVLKEYPNGLDHKEDMLAMYARHRAGIINGKDKYAWLDEGKVVLRSGDGVRGADPKLYIKLSHFYAVAAEHRDEMKAKPAGEKGYDQAYNYPDALALYLYRYLSDVVAPEDRKKIDTYITELETDLGLRTAPAPVAAPPGLPDFGAIFKNINFGAIMSAMPPSQNGQPPTNIPFDSIVSEVFKGLQKSGVLGVSAPATPPAEVATIVGAMGALQSSISQIVNDGKLVPLQAAVAAVRDIPNSAIPSGVAATFSATASAAIQESKKDAVVAVPAPTAVVSASAAPAVSASPAPAVSASPAPAVPTTVIISVTPPSDPAPPTGPKIEELP